MITNSLLKAKSDAQRKLNRDAKGNLATYAAGLRDDVRVAEKEYDLVFSYETEQSESPDQQAARRKRAV